MPSCCNTGVTGNAKQKRGIVTDYLINKIAPDWLTLTTTNRAQYEIARGEFIFRNWGEGKKIMQYEGVGTGALFCGEGEQMGRPSYMLQVSGIEAALFYDDMFVSGGLVRGMWKASRLDLQLTLIIPTYQLVGWQWVGRNEGRRVVTHEESKAGDTVYLGSKQAEKFARIYVKHWDRDDVGDYSQHIRVEFQLRKDTANRYWQSGEWVGGYANLWDGINGRVPRVAGYSHCLCPTLVAAYDSALTFPDSFTLGVKNTDKQTKQWVIDAVDPALLKLIHSHDRQDKEFISMFLEKWYAAIVASIEV